jgi:hypothetical protein
MKYAVEIGSGAMIYIPTFIRIGTGTPSGAQNSGYGEWHPEVPELPSAWGYSWATLSPGVINTER